MAARDCRSIAASIRRPGSSPAPFRSGAAVSARRTRWSTSCIHAAVPAHARILTRTPTPTSRAKSVSRTSFPATSGTSRGNSVSTLATLRLRTGTTDVSTVGRYYTVPFTQMQQGGFGKVAPYFNLRAIDTVALGVVVGWADVYIDDV